MLMTDYYWGLSGPTACRRSDSCGISVEFKQKDGEEGKLSSVPQPDWYVTCRVPVSTRRSRLCYMLLMVPSNRT